MSGATTGFTHTRLFVGWDNKTANIDATRVRTNFKFTQVYAGSRVTYRRYSGPYQVASCRVTTSQTIIPYPSGTNYSITPCGGWPVPHSVLTTFLIFETSPHAQYDPKLRETAETKDRWIVRRKTVPVTKTKARSNSGFPFHLFRLAEYIRYLCHLLRLSESSGDHTVD